MIFWRVVKQVVKISKKHDTACCYAFVGNPAKGVGRVTGARVQIPLSPPDKAVTQKCNCFVFYLNLCTGTARRNFMLSNTGFDLWADNYDKDVGISNEENCYPFAGYKKF